MVSFIAESYWNIFSWIFYIFIFFLYFNTIPESILGPRGFCREQKYKCLIENNFYPSKLLQYGILMLVQTEQENISFRIFCFHVIRNPRGLCIPLGGLCNFLFCNFWWKSGYKIRAGCCRKNVALHRSLQEYSKVGQGSQRR